jgi:Tfp pilus assembly protein PilP
MKRAVIGLCLLLALAGCKQQQAIVCPSLVPYSSDFQKALDREIAALEAPYTFQMLNDYGVTRDAIRKCLKRRNKK